MHGSNPSELLEHPEIPDVSCVQDGVGGACRQVLGGLRVWL
jgi:hypothetical protein